MQEVRVLTRNRQISMPQIIPHLHHIHPLGQPAAGGGVAEQMRPHLRLPDGGPGEEGADLVIENDGLHGGALIGHQQVVAG